YGQFQVSTEGMIVGADGILSGTKREFVVPVGRTRVTQNNGEEVLEQFVDVRSCETQTVKFGTD
ncbi:MAG: hypothetical protein ACI87A_002490, partial [Planctomycetota bacterium]